MYLCTEFYMMKGIKTIRLRGIMTGSLRVYAVGLLLLPLAMLGQRARYSLDFTLSKKNFADTIAIVLEPNGSRVLLPVSIGGSSHLFLLDTGASHAVVYEDAMIAGCEPVGTIDSYDANERVSRVPTVKLPPLTIGSLTLTGCQATVQRRRVRHGDIDGIIGFDLVRKGLQMKIDVENRRLILSDRKKIFVKEPGYRLKYRLRWNVPYVEVSPFREYHETVRFDTGSPRLYVINKESFDKGEPLMANRRQIEGRCLGRWMMGFSGTEPRGEVVFLALDSLCVGGFAMRDVHTLSTQQGNSHVGAELLRYGAVTFIPNKKTMLFQPYTEEGSCTVGNSQVEKAVVPSDDGRPMIGLVWEGGEAFKAGFREGDIILKADGRDVGSFQDYRRYRPIKKHVYTVEVIDVLGYTKTVMATW